MSATKDFFLQNVTLSLNTLVTLIETAQVCGDDTTELAAQVCDAWLACEDDDPSANALHLLACVLEGRTNRAEAPY